MNRLNHFSTTVLQFPNVISWSLLRRGLPALLLAPALGLLALSPTAQAVTPQPDGGYPNANTAEGEDALFSLTTGIQNTAVGNEALQTNTAGNSNTAIGSGALVANIGDNNTAVGAVALVSNYTGTGNVASRRNGNRDPACIQWRSAARRRG